MTKRSGLRFATRALLLQIAVVCVVVAVTVSIFGWLGVAQLRRDAESDALAIARTIADDVDVVAEVGRMHDAGDVPSRETLATGPVQAQAERVRARTGALFIVITNADGIRLSHPDPSRLGEVVSTSDDRALSGVEEIAWQQGTLGESARAKVPVFEPGTTTPIGQVSVGFAPVSVFAALPELVAGLVLAAGFALAVGALAAWRMRRWLSGITLGLQPEELRALVQEQAAVLEGVGEGVLAVTDEGEVTVCNERAADMLGLAEGDAAGGPGGSPSRGGASASGAGPVARPDRDRGVVGRDVRELRLPEALRRVLEGGSEASFAVGDRVVYAEGHRVVREGRDLGTVVVLRDRTDIEALSAKLDAVQSMTNALRAQRHEFANRLHVLAGLMDAGRDAEARGVIADALAVDPRDARVESAELVHDEYLRALVTALSIEARERSVHLRLGPETLVLGRVVAPEDVATILGNLVGNAVRAAVAAPVPRWVEVELLDDGDELFATVSDSGDGIRDPEAVFEGRGARDADGAPDGIAAPAADGSAGGGPVHGHGIGLPLCRGIARARGGDVWIVDAGSAAEEGAGAPAGESRAPGAPGDEPEPEPEPAAGVGAHGSAPARAAGERSGASAAAVPVLRSGPVQGSDPASARVREAAAGRPDDDRAGRVRRGAVVCARLPGVMAARAAADPRDSESEEDGPGSRARGIAGPGEGREG